MKRKIKTWDDEGGSFLERGGWDGKFRLERRSGRARLDHGLLCSASVSKLSAVRSCSGHQSVGTRRVEGDLTLNSLKSKARRKRCC